MVVEAFVELLAEIGLPVVEVLVEVLADSDHKPKPRKRGPRQRKDLPSRSGDDIA